MLEALHSTKSVRLWASLAAKLNSFAKESSLVQRIGKQFSPQALQQRITRTECGVEGFLGRCLSHICQWNFLNTRPAGSSPFGRIIIEDSTFVRFPKGNAEEFPGHGNASGATAGCKVDLAFDLPGGELIRHELHPGTEQDKTIGADLLDELPESIASVGSLRWFSEHGNKLAIYPRHSIERAVRSISRDWYLRG